MKSVQGYRRSWHLKVFSIFSSGSHLVYQNNMFLAVLVGIHLGNIPEKFESHLPKGLGEDSFKTNLFMFFNV